MSDTTKIQWADATFNPWIGCMKVSAGCAHCYSENTTRARVLRAQGHETWGKGAKRARTSVAYWQGPLLWNMTPSICNCCGEEMNSEQASKHRHGTIIPSFRRRRVFPSLCDWLDDELPIEWLADFLKLINDTPNLDWLLLTKRPENFHARVQAALWKIEGLDDDDDGDSEDLPRTAAGSMVNEWLGGKGPDNVWIGTSCENQAMADRRVPQILKIPASIRFLSLEPLLEGINLAQANWLNRVECGYKIDWMIVGGESGPAARRCHIEWIDDVRHQCATASVPCFVKQMGGNAVCSNVNLYDFDCLDEKLLVPTCCIEGAAACGLSFRDRKGGDPDEWPEELRVREFPRRGK